MYKTVGQALDIAGGDRAKETNCSMDDAPTKGVLVLPNE